MSAKVFGSRLLAMVLGIAALPLSAAAETGQAGDPTPHYAVYAIRYATITDLPVSMFVAGADAARTTSAAMMIWLIRGNGRVILLDTGFYHKRFFKDWKVSDYIKPSDALAALGLKPADVTDIVISHMHWDHLDGADLFPNARIWIQRDEYTYYTGDAWHGDAHGGIDPENVMTLVRLNTKGRVSFVEGDEQTLFPGITAYIGGKHTFQSQFVSVRSDAGTIVLASDNLYFFENLDKHVAIGTTLDAASNVRAQDRMRQLASRPDLIVPGHDPAVFDRYPAQSRRVVQIQALAP